MPEKKQIKAVKTEKPVKAQKEKQEKPSVQKIAVVRIAGHVRLRNVIKDTLHMLNLNKKNHCVILDVTPTITGMINKVKDKVTWGEVSEETINMLKEKRDKGEKYFALQPPRGGFERKGTKIPFKIGGALGYRKDKINDLIQRMI